MHQCSGCGGAFVPLRTLSKLRTEARSSTEDAHDVALEAGLTLLLLLIAALLDAI